MRPPHDDPARSRVCGRLVNVGKLIAGSLAEIERPVGHVEHLLCFGDVPGEPSSRGVIDGERARILEFRSAHVNHEQDARDQYGPDRCGNRCREFSQRHEAARYFEQLRQRTERARGRDRQDDTGNHSVAGDPISPRRVQTDKCNGRRPERDEQEQRSAPTGDLHCELKQAEQSEREKQRRHGGTKDLEHPKRRKPVCVQHWLGRGEGLFSLERVRARLWRECQHPRDARLCAQSPPEGDVWAGQEQHSDHNARDVPEGALALEPGGPE